jgi:hypothetical protein
MRTNWLLVVTAVVLLEPVVRAAEPAGVALPERVTVQTSLVTLGQVASISGDAEIRERLARLDIAEFKSHDRGLTISRRAVEYRLVLAGIDPATVRVMGAERMVIGVTRRMLTAEEVVAAARAELLRDLSTPGMAIELAKPLAVKLPEVVSGDPLTIAAKPRPPIGGPGRVQMDVTISSGGEELLALPVYLDVKAAVASGVAPAGGREPMSPVTQVGNVLVRARQRVTLLVRSGSLTVTAVGEAQQDGRLGQTIPVLNADSKKLLTAKVTGPAAVEVELGGGP